jgi:hypothetical protein
MRAIILLLMSTVLLSAADPKKMLAERASRAAPAGTPEVYEIIWAAGYYDADELARRQAALPYKTISIDRSGCYGACPTYTVTFNRDGSAEMDARAYLPRLGHFVGKIRVTTFARICYALDRMGFFQLNPAPSPWTGGKRNVYRIMGSLVPSNSGLSK